MHAAGFLWRAQVAGSYPRAGRAWPPGGAAAYNTGFRTGRDRRMPWYVYLIECCDGSIYTGITNDVAARYATHAAGRGARYTRSRPPLRLLATVSYPDRSSAARAEVAVKRLTAQRKRELVAALAAVAAPGLSAAGG